MIRAGIIGGAGYTAGELIRILVNHPECEIAFVQSISNCANRVDSVHQGLLGDTDLVFCEDFDLSSVDVLFLCSGHGASRAFWESHTAPEGLKIIDLAQDFRDQSDGYVYGLPEWQKDRIAGASKVANPGCFATAVQLSLLPLAMAGELLGPVTVNAITGSTGAGVKPSQTTHFSWRNSNLSAYKVFEHQHLLEINRNLSSVTDDRFEISFIPVRGDFSRGIFSTAVLNCRDLTLQQLTDLYRGLYENCPFTLVSDRPVDLKDVVNTNKALLQLQKHDNRLCVTCVLDNLLKGASGQAVQNMNIMFGLDQRTGLKLKASAF